MNDYEKMFTEKLQQALKDKIYGKVFVNIKNDQIYVHIKCWNDIDYECYIDDFANKFINGLNSEYVCYMILQAYRKFVVQRYFK